MAIYDLTQQHLAELPHYQSVLTFLIFIVHGNDWNSVSKTRTFIGLGTSKLSDAERMRLRMRIEARNKITKSANRVVLIAFCLNFCDVIGKFAAAYLTGSKSLFAEGIHSTMDTVNQLILLMGIRFSQKNPDLNFPYGYGNMRYVASLISGCGILSFGCGLSVYHGISGLLHSVELVPLTYAYYALSMSFVFQGCSASIAFREVRRKAALAKMSIFNYVRTSGDPSLNVVLLEDTASVTGVAIAFTAVSLSSFLNSCIPDCIGSIMIGCLLGTVASFIIRNNAAHLVGRSLPKRITDDIICRLENDPMIRSVHDVKATALGVEQSRFKAELNFDGRAITDKAVSDEDSLRAFMTEHGEKIIDKLGEEVDRIEAEITTKHPDIIHVDLEAL
ncbi:unnamed protein product [Enterobius vermicularis]|uniref:Zinc transporter 9 n=1 Tax=Enterobius vermicularis TaxID=51028 RepID=A0A0N4VK17_ENTVE|nr:unnamed protein product [Enterobius vermicularis]